VGWARASELHKLAVEVFAHNAPTISLLDKLGFTREGLRPRHYRRRNGELWDVVVFGLPLRDQNDEGA
jgi:putative acetyltransferase